MAILKRAIEILLIEDNPSDILLTKEAFAESDLQSNLHTAQDGCDGLDFIHKRGKFKDAVTPDIILLDLNMPKKNGKEVLEDIKQNDATRLIPVIVLTTSHDENDIRECYQLQANSYIPKPVNYADFVHIVGIIKLFWFETATLPSMFNR